VQDVPLKLYFCVFYITILNINILQSTQITMMSCVSTDSVIQVGSVLVYENLISLTDSAHYHIVTSVLSYL